MLMKTPSTDDNRKDRFKAIVMVKYYTCMSIVQCTLGSADENVKYGNTMPNFNKSSMLLYYLCNIYLISKE